MNKKNILNIMLALICATSIYSFSGTITATSSEDAKHGAHGKHGQNKEDG